MPPIESPVPAVTRIITGYFQERRNYSTWRTNGTSDYLLMFTLSGAGRIGYSNSGSGMEEGASEKTVQTGDIVLIRPDTRHDYGTARGAEGWELIWTHFFPYPHWLEWLVWPEIAPGIGFLSLKEGEERDDVRQALQEMYRRANGGSVRREEFAMNALEEAILLCDAVNPRSERASVDPRVARAMHYLRERLAEPVALPELSRLVGLSPSRLSYLFRQQTGQTPGQFIEGERIFRARQLLTLTSRPIAAIAAEVGFESPFYFTLRFRKHTGFSPRAFREQANSESGR